MLHQAAKGSLQRAECEEVPPSSDLSEYSYILPFPFNSLYVIPFLPFSISYLPILIYSSFSYLSLPPPPSYLLFTPLTSSLLNPHITFLNFSTPFIYKFTPYQSYPTNQPPNQTYLNIKQPKYSIYSPLQFLSSSLTLPHPPTTSTSHPITYPNNSPHH